jgi:hypothetical protein
VTWPKGSDTEVRLSHATAGSGEAAWAEPAAARPSEAAATAGMRAKADLRREHRAKGNLLMI